MVNTEENILCKRFLNLLVYQLESFFEKPVEIVFKKVSSFLYKVKIYRNRVLLTLSSDCDMERQEVFQAVFDSLTKKDKRALFYLQSLVSDKEKRNIVSKGSFYDLQEIFDSVNSKFFNNAIQLNIGWFGNGVKKNLRTVIFGR